MIDELFAIKRRVSDMLSRLMRIISVGVVVDVDSAGQRVKVELPGLDKAMTGWMRVLARRSIGVRTSCNLKVGEQVLCLFPPVGDMKVGYVLGALYNQVDKPFQGDPDVFGVEFEDGAVMSYDQKNHMLRFTMPGGTRLFEMTPEGARLVSNLDIDGDVTITQSLTVDGGITGSTVSDATGSMDTMRGQYNKHGHPDDGAGKPTVPMS